MTKASLLRNLETGVYYRETPEALREHAEEVAATAREWRGVPALCPVSGDRREGGVSARIYCPDLAPQVQPGSGGCEPRRYSMTAP